MSAPFLVFGNEEGRRVAGFQAALRDLGEPPARVVPWLDVLRHPERLDDLPRDPHLVRLESPGEDEVVARELLAAGYADAVALGAHTIAPDLARRLPADRGRIVCPRQLHCGFLVALARLERLFADRPAWDVLNPPADVAVLFDKREASARYAALGIPVAPRLDGVASADDLRGAMDAAACRRAFVKLACGSSASCLAIYTRDPAGDSLLTTIEVARTGWYNSLRLSDVTRPARVDGIVGFLLREGSIVEEEIPKARIEGAVFDCRVLVVDGEPAFLVVRQSDHPVTNLHLGGRRGDVTAFEAAIPADVRDAALESCRRVWAAHGCQHVGVDLLFTEDRRSHAVVEANAFGDLLPNVTREGLSVYQWEIRSARSR